LHSDIPIISKSFKQCMLNAPSSPGSVGNSKAPYMVCQKPPAGLSPSFLLLSMSSWVSSLLVSFPPHTCAS
jgi:hypothetical protein